MPATVETPRTRQQRSQGREFYSSLKTCGPAQALPPLRALPPGLPPDPLQPKVSTDDSKAVSGRATDSTLPIEVTSVDAALAALAARVGSMYGLPELHVLIHDTVSVTLRGINRIVETHVHRVLENEKLGVVQEMVTRLLTEEVVRVTTQSAHQLFRREVGAMDSNQKRALDSLARAEKEWQHRLEETSQLQLALEEQCKRNATEHEGLRYRVDDIEHDLAKLPNTIKELAETADRVESLHTSQSGAHAEFQVLEDNFSKFKQRSEESFVSRSESAQLSLDLQRLERWQENRGNEWFESMMEPYVQKQEVLDQLREIEARIGDQTERISDAFAHAIDDTRRTALAKCREIETDNATQSMLSEIQQVEQDSRLQLEEKLKTELANLRKECAMQDFVHRSLDTQHREHVSLVETHSKLQTQVEQQAVKFEDALAVLKNLFAKNIEGGNTLESRVKTNCLEVTALREQNALIREHFNDEKKRIDSIFNQQGQNRNELNHMIGHVNDIETIRANVEKLQFGSEKQAETIQVLHQEVAQWEQAIVAQQGLRKETAQLRANIDEIKGNVAQIEKQQTLGIENLRALHTSWLNPAPATAAG